MQIDIPEIKFKVYDKFNDKFHDSDSKHFQSLYHFFHIMSLYKGGGNDLIYLPNVRRKINDKEVYLGDIFECKTTDGTGYCLVTYEKETGNFVWCRYPIPVITDEEITTQFHITTEINPLIKEHEEGTIQLKYFGNIFSPPKPEADKQ